MTFQLSPHSHSSSSAHGPFSVDLHYAPASLCLPRSGRAVSLPAITMSNLHAKKFGDPLPFRNSPVLLPWPAPSVIPEPCFASLAETELATRCLSDRSVVC
ncbi:hypothetical protein BKA67DRAFT_554624 [Truncatella angustata]|uniref:Uncharacterized protein n=1 Tax=Truncatella angustata TaxID=152316 RepID=A0A9P8US72_9PEZI|nr:uncharacterized protein BKA67DRAFT_554624 [Truncatella angustata]KAH6657226.1 hypothetical protein BKA67DRAFT_554624 [Truncatella angustata]